MDNQEGVTKDPIVIDIGSGVMKVGFAGEMKPLLVFNTYVGQTKHSKVMISALAKDNFIGSDCDKYRGLVKLSYPIEHGVVQNWDNMEKIFRYIFDELKVNPKEHPVLLTEPVLNPIWHRIRMAQMMFENFGVPGVYFQNQSVLSLYARGLTTGVVLDCGDGVTTASAVYEGYSIANATQRMDLGGRDVTAHLMQLLRRAGYSLHTSSEFEIVRQIKERFCLVEPFSNAQQPNQSFLSLAGAGGGAFDNRFGGMGKDKDYGSGFDARVKGKDSGLGGADKADRQGDQVSYTLPDGQQLKIGNEKRVAPEILFRPELIGLEYPGVHDMVLNCIQKCDIDLRKGLYGSIVVAGSTTLMRDFCDRLHKQIAQVKKDVKPTLIAPTNRHYSCWVGGATVSSLKAFSKMWMTRRMFEEDGRISSLHGF